MKKHFGILNIAFWLASNKRLWTRKCNRCSWFIEFFCYELQFRHLFLLLSVTWTPLKLGEFLQLKAGLKLMTNSGQVYLFSNLITLVQWWVLSRCRGNISSFYFFQGPNLLVDDQNFKRGGDVKKTEDYILKRESFLLFYQPHVVSHFDFVPFIPVSPDTTLKERRLV